MNIEQARRACRNPRAIPLGSRFIVVNTANGEPIEGYFNRSRALLAAQGLNEHESRNHRPEVYGVRELEGYGMRSASAAPRAFRG